MKGGSPIFACETQSHETPSPKLESLLSLKLEPLPAPVSSVTNRSNVSRVTTERYWRAPAIEGRRWHCCSLMQLTSHTRFDETRWIIWVYKSDSGRPGGVSSRSTRSGSSPLAISKWACAQSATATARWPPASSAFLISGRVWEFRIAHKTSRNGFTRFLRQQPFVHA